MRYIHGVNAAPGGWETWTWDESLFAGTAGYYEQGRLPYAPGLADALALMPKGVKEGQTAAKDFAAPLKRAAAAIDDGRALTALDRLVAISNDDL